MRADRAGRRQGLLPPLTVCRSLSRTQPALGLQPWRNYLKLEAQGAEIKSEQQFLLPFLPLCPEGECLLGICVDPWVALHWTWGCEAAGLMHRDLRWTWTREVCGGCMGSWPMPAPLEVGGGGPGYLPPGSAALGQGRAATSGLGGVAESVGGSVSELASVFGSNGSWRMKMGWWVKEMWWQPGEPLRHP